MVKKTAQEIDVESADWAARIDAGPLSDGQKVALEFWLAGDVRCLGAFARMQAIAAVTDRARALGQSFVPPDVSRMPSRRILLVGGTAVAATALVGIVGMGSFPTSSENYRTAKGEARVVALEDGSVLTLNTDTELDVSYSNQRRSVTLLRGEAVFDVAKNPKRPFFVAAGEVTVRVVGTSFSVSKLDASPIQILVREGIVDVSLPARPGAPSVRLLRNNKTLVQSGATGISRSAVGDTELQRSLAWLDGHLAFEGQTLEQAAAEFARYSDTKIVIADPSLAHEEIAGFYRANDPVGFAKSIAISLNAHVEVGAGKVQLSR